MNPEAPQASPTSTTTTGGRRRSSGFMPAFEGLQKRTSEANAARRASMTDQQQKGGMFSTFFHNNFGRNASSK